jgi:CrcB protein
MGWILVIIGGGAGALIRYLLSLWIQNSHSRQFPLGTLVVNLAGCLLIGILYRVFEKTSLLPEIRLMVFTGLLGGFTTFSSFGLETFQLLRSSEYFQAFLYAGLSNGAGILLVFAGYYFTYLITGPYPDLNRS